MRLPALVCALVAIAVATSASAQTKKKKPKKPKTEQKREAEEPSEPAPAPSSSSDPPKHDDPPKIDTNLREEDAPAPSTNPWVLSGESKKRGVSAAKPGESSSPPAGGSRSSGVPGTEDDHVSSSDHGSDRKKKSDDEWTSRPIALTAIGGYASADLRIGFGVRAGYSIADHFYIGGAFMYHLGTTFGDITLGGYYPSAELGYDYHVLGYTIRPYAGLGMFFTRLSGNTAGLELKDSSALAFYPGIQFDYQIGPGFVGVDARVLFIFENGRDTSLGFFAVGGARF